MLTLDRTATAVGTDNVDTVTDFAQAVVDLRAEYLAGQDANEVDRKGTELLRQIEDLADLGPEEQVAVNRILLDLHGLLNSVYSGA